MHELASAVAKILQRAVRIDTRAFIQECAYIGKLRQKRLLVLGAAIRDVRLFEVVRYSWTEITYVILFAHMPKVY